jgi:hypothetical protein
MAAMNKSLARSNKSRTRDKRPRSVNPATTVLRREKLSIKSVLSVAIILGLTCVQAQAGPKRQLDPQAEPRSLNHRDDMSSARRDIQASEQLRREEAQSRDDGDPNKGWTYDVLFMRRSLSGTSSTVYPTHYGVYTSKEQCEQARVARIDRMERKNNSPDDLDAPVQFPLQAWYSENSKQTEQTQTQAAALGGTPSQVSVSTRGGAESTGATQTEGKRGGDQRTMLFKHCVPSTDAELSSIPRPAPRPGPGGTGYRRAENQQ